MEAITIEDAVKMMQQAKHITFLTGAGVSTASGIPDYRSLKGVYHGLDQPEYLLSHTCMLREPEKFYEFVQKLYHPDAKPNVIHEKIAAMEKEKDCWVVSQNIDGLHEKAGSQHCVNFHGNIYDCYCRKCQQKVDYQEYMQSDVHRDCGGQIRPGIVLYEEGFTQDVLDSAVNAVRNADLIVIVGTTFQVHPFCDLIHYKRADAKVLVINQTPIYLPIQAFMLQKNAVEVFEKL